jgi:hypothetical protein
MWGAIGRWIGKGVGWLIRHPEVIDGGIKVVKGIRKKKPFDAKTDTDLLQNELPEEAPLPDVGNTEETKP